MWQQISAILWLASVMITQAQQTDAGPCSRYEVKLGDQCVQCSNLLFGCRQCELQDKLLFGRVEQTVQCTTCDYSMYLLTFEGSQLKLNSDDEGKFGQKQSLVHLNMCLYRCEDFAHNYVSNPNKMRCEFCGPECSHCTLQYGCTQCFGSGNKQFTLPESYKNHVQSEIKQPIFPYSFNDFTPNHAPSSQFGTCVNCSSLDARCSQCDNQFKDLPTEKSDIDFNTKICDACPFWVQSESQQNSNSNCRLSSQFGQAPEDDCLQVNEDETCSACKSGFYLQAGECNSCSNAPNASEGCHRCSSTGCLECKEGYTLDGNQCRLCNLQSQNENLYALMPDNRCFSCSASNQGECDICKVGWKNSYNKHTTFLNDTLSRGDKIRLKPCNLKCGFDQFPKVEYETINDDQYVMKNKTCENCAVEGCIRCLSNEPDSCVECKKGTYVAIVDQKKMSGRCVEKKLFFESDIVLDDYFFDADDFQGKTESEKKTFLVKQDSSLQKEYLNLYVSNDIDERLKPGRQRNGTFEDPFATITDALDHALEIVAPFTDNVNVTIHLFSGDHFLLENRFDAMNIYHLKWSIDAFSLNQNLNIKPLHCSHQTAFKRKIDPKNCVKINSEKVRIFNKRRERLMFKVFASLKLESIVIDSLDSILPFGDTCLSEYRQCCKVSYTRESPKISNFDDTDTITECKQAFEDLKLTDQCLFGEPRTLFKMISTNDYPVYEEVSNNILSLENSELRNFYYGMNSMVNLTRHGGQVVFNQTKVEGINICGSLIKNEYQPRLKPDFKKITQDLMSNGTKKLIDITTKLQVDLMNEYNQYYELNLDDGYLYDENKIILEDSHFNWLNYQSKPINESLKHSKSSKMRHQSLVINVDRFQGEVRIQNSTFSNNFFRYMTCSVVNQTAKGFLPVAINEQAPAITNSTGNSQSNATQVSQVGDFNITNNFRAAFMNKSETYDLEQIKNLISVRNHIFKVSLIGNTFEHNSATKGIIEIEIGASSFNPVLVHNNTFAHNSALFDSNTLIIRKKAFNLLGSEYIDVSQLECGGIMISENRFVGNIGCRNTFGVLRMYCMDEGLTSNSSIFGGKVRYVPQLDSQYFIGNVSDLRTASYQPNMMPEISSYQAETNFTWKNKTIFANLYKVILKENIYEQNFAGNQRSLLDIQGFPLIFSQGEMYKNNENWHPLAFERMADFGLTRGNVTTNATITDRDLQLFEFKSESMVSVWRALSVILDGTTFNNNFVIDDIPQSVLGDQPEETRQSHSFFLRDFIGQLLLQGNTSFVNHTGISGSSFLRGKLSPSLISHGYKTNLFNFQRFEFTKFMMNEVRFSSNQAYRYPFEDSLQPYLFNISKESFVNRDVLFQPYTSRETLLQYLLLKDVEISDNVFLNSKTMVHMERMNMTYDGFQIHRNGRRLELIDGQDKQYAADETQAIITLNISAYDNLELTRWNASDNHFRNGSIVMLETHYEGQIKHQGIQMLIDGKSKFQNNTSFGRPSILTLTGRFPWLWLRIQNCTLENNFAIFSNEFETHDLLKFDFFDSTWLQFENQVHWDNIKKIDPSTRAKVLMREENYLEVNVINSVFDCRMPVNQTKILDFKRDQKTFEAPLFNLKIDSPKKRYFLSHFHPLDPISFTEEHGTKALQDIRGLNCFAVTDTQNITEFEFANPYNQHFLCEFDFKSYNFKANKYQNCNNGYRGSIFYLEKGAELNLIGGNEDATNNSAVMGGFAYVKDPKTKIIISENLGIMSQRAYFGGALYLTDYAELYADKMRIENGQVYEGMIYLQSFATANISRTLFYRNFAFHRAMIQAKDYSFFTIKDSEFVMNEASRQSVIAYIDGATDLSVINPSSNQTTLAVGQIQESVMRNVSILNNKNTAGGNLIQVFGSNFRLFDSKIEGNILFKRIGGIQALQSHLEVHNSSFDMGQEDSFFRNDSTLMSNFISQGGFIFLGGNSSLNSSLNNFTNARAYLGGCVSIQGDSWANFTRDNFTRCTAEIGGAIYASNFDNLYVTECSFHQNIVFQGKGQNILAQRFNGVFKMQNTSMSTFTNAVFVEDGMNMIIQNVSIVLDKNLIQRTDNATFYNFFLERANSTRLEDEEVERLRQEKKKLLGNSSEEAEKEALIDLFKDENNRTRFQVLLSESNFQKYGGGFHIINMKHISNFSDVMMANLRAENGGCIYIELEQNLRELNNTFNSDPYYFNNLNLTSCVADNDGGAINIRNVRRIKLDGERTLLYNSYAFHSGGGINFDCDNYDIDDCQLELGPIRIINNTAKVNGGGIYQQQYKPIQHSMTVIRNNSAGIYGMNVASFPIKVVRLQTQRNSLGEVLPGQGADDVYSAYLNLDGKQALPPITQQMAEYPRVGKTFFIESVQSGGFIADQYLAMLDEYDQVCASDRGTKINITISDPQTVINGEMIFFSANGVYNIKGMEIYTTPNSDIQMQGKMDPGGIQTNDGRAYQIAFDLDIDECQIGQAQLQKGNNFICKKCEFNTYLLQKPEPKVETPCRPCIKGRAICLGGFQIGPVEGYWRKSNYTDFFIPCKFKEACVGLMVNNISETYSPTGNCAEGYYGALCSSCIPGWNKMDAFQCKQCEPEWDLIRIIGVFTIAVTGVVMLIRGTIHEDNQKKLQTHSVFIKIMMNHLQMILITSSFDMKWPTILVDFFKRISIIQELQQMIVAFDCFIDNRMWSKDEMDIRILQFEDPEEDSLRITYYRLFIYASLPIMCGVASYSVWWVIFFCRGHLKDEQMRGRLYIKFLSSFVILLFIVHPMITQFMIDMFNCQSYDGDIRLEMDLQIICFQHKHYTFLYFLALPCFLIWGLGIPAMIYVLMRKEKNNLETDAAKIKFGFLFNGYKTSNFTWEIVIMYRKTICLCLSVFLRDIGIIVQALVLLILMVAFLSLNSSLRPFKERTLNEIENISLSTQIITIYCGLFFISRVDGNSQNFNPNTDFTMTDEQIYVFFFIIVIVNMVFFFVWCFKFLMSMKRMLKQTYPNIYIIIFLCCRRDKLEKDEVKLAREAKRETIIEKIEDIQFFIKNMKQIYSSEIFYEGHDKFIKLLYQIEDQKKDIDMTVKRHNLYIQGKMARERKFNPEKIIEKMDIPSLQVVTNPDMWLKTEVERYKKAPNIMSNEEETDLQYKIKQKMNNISKRKNVNQIRLDPNDIENMRMHFTDSKTNDSIGMVTPIATPIVIDPRFQLGLPVQPSSNNMTFAQNSPDSGRLNINLQRMNPSSFKTQPDRDQKKNQPVFNAKEKEKEKMKKLKEKMQFIANQGDDIVKMSRNTKAQINYEHKSRVFLQDLENEHHARTYMIELFKDFKQKESRSSSDYDSPYKDTSQNMDGTDRNEVETKGPIPAPNYGSLLSPIRPQESALGGDAGSSRSKASKSKKNSKRRDSKRSLKTSQSPKTKRRGSKVSVFSEILPQAVLNTKVISEQSSKSNKSRKSRNKSFEEKKRLVLRPHTNVQYNMVIHNRDQSIQIVENVKPLHGKKKKQFYESLSESGKQPDGESDVLKISILKSDDSNSIRMNYREQKQKGAFEGSLSERDAEEIRNRIGYSVGRFEQDQFGDITGNTRDAQFLNLHPQENTNKDSSDPTEPSHLMSIRKKTVFQSGRFPVNDPNHIELGESSGKHQNLRSPKSSMFMSQTISDQEKPFIKQNTLLSPVSSRIGKLLRKNHLDKEFRIQRDDFKKETQKGE